MKEPTFGETAEQLHEIEAANPDAGENLKYIIFAEAYKKGYAAAQNAQEAKNRRG